MPVYIVRAGEHGPVKIGYADDVASRLVKMQSDNHERLTVLRIFVGNQAEEKRLHLRFRHLHLHGEWHAWSREMLGNLDLPEESPKEVVSAIEVRAVEAKAAIFARVVPPDFSARLTTARKAARLTQRDLAKLVGMSRANIACYETGKYHPQLSRIPVLAAAVGVKVEWFFGEEAAA